MASRYTSPETLAITGRSNGGLLVGAALTQRPDLFRAVVCGYPLLDMLRYHRFFVAGYWVPEYGSADDPALLDVLRAYSPYHNVKKGVRYPAVLLVTGDGDTRVAPLHARKMTALLQAATASGPDRPVLLHYDTKAGHSAGMSASKQIEDLTQEMAFLFWQLGLRKESRSRFWRVALSEERRRHCVLRLHDRGGHCYLLEQHAALRRDCSRGSERWCCRAVRRD